jgi:hypothetical protein
LHEGILVHSLQFFHLRIRKRETTASAPVPARRENEQIVISAMTRSHVGSICSATGPDTLHWMSAGRKRQREGSLRAGAGAGKEKMNKSSWKKLLPRQPLTRPIYTTRLNRQGAESSRGFLKSSWYSR